MKSVVFEKRSVDRAVLAEKPLREIQTENRLAVDKFPRKFVCLGNARGGVRALSPFR